MTVMPPGAPAAAGALNVAPSWTEVELFTGEQRLRCRVLFRGRLRERLLDTEPSIVIHDATTVAARRSVPHLNGVPEGMIRRQNVVAGWVPGGEPADPDGPETIERPVLVVGAGWTAAGAVHIPAGADRSHHLAFIQKSPFCQLFALQLTADWDGTPSAWSVPEAYVNLDLATALYLG